jgi:hypothetical protein
MTASFSGTAAGGTLTVSNGKNSVALKLLGNYTTSSWTLSKDGTGGTRVVDPPAAGLLAADANDGVLPVNGGPLDDPQSILDVLWRNGQTHDTGLSSINDSIFAAWQDSGTTGSGYGAAAVSDRFDNGTSDVLFPGNSSGDTRLGAISNGGFAGYNQIGGSDTDHRVAGVADFYGTGDNLFPNTSSGDTWPEAISSGAFASSQQNGGSDTNYSFACIGDYFGTNTSDILFRNASTGGTWLEAISNGSFAGWNHIGGSSTSYSVPIMVGPPALT